MSRFSIVFLLVSALSLFHILFATFSYNFYCIVLCFDLTLHLCSQMVLPIAVEDVKREVQILKALSGHENVVQFYNAFEDDDYVYIVMESVSLAPSYLFILYGVLLCNESSLYFIRLSGFTFESRFFLGCAREANCSIGYYPS